jgi:hypothetical protein
VSERPYIFLTQQVSRDELARLYPKRENTMATEKQVVSHGIVSYLSEDGAARPLLVIRSRRLYETGTTTVIGNVIDGIVFDDVEENLRHAGYAPQPAQMMRVARGVLEDQAALRPGTWHWPMEDLTEEDKQLNADLGKLFRDSYRDEILTAVEGRVSKLLNDHTASIQKLIEDGLMRVPHISKDTDFANDDASTLAKGIPFMTEGEISTLRENTGTSKAPEQAATTTATAEMPASSDHLGATEGERSMMDTVQNTPIMKPRDPA